MTSYRDSITPWCIIRAFPNARTVIVARFRRRSDAEAQLYTLQRILPSVPLSIMFDGAIRRADAHSATDDDSSNRRSERSPS